MAYDQHFPCPDCSTPIYFDALALVRGEHFSCEKCHVSVSIAPNSRQQVESAMAKFDTMKKDLFRPKTTPN